MCLLTSVITCGISIALFIQSLDPRWGLGAKDFTAPIHLPPLGLNKLVQGFHLNPIVQIGFKQPAKKTAIFL